MDPIVVAQCLESAGATNVAAYYSKLTNNASVKEVLRDLLAEANAALMFRNHGIAVEMGESPDLTLEVSGQTICAEVKHFRRKLQDDEDEKRLAEYGSLLVEYGDTIPTEVTTPWDQVVAVARRKTR
jgi:hypothetical protein